MLRFCIILGAPKAGTTSLFNYLAQHPEIAPCQKKEPNFFSKHYDKDYNWYISLWKKDAAKNKVLLEATVNYTNCTLSSESSKNMLDFYEHHDVSIKFIYVMRDPIERLESHYTYNYAHLISWPLKTALKKGYIIRTSRYAEQLDLYFEKFNSENFLLLDFDDLTNDTAVILEKICKFLEIDARFSFSGLNKVHNKSVGVRVTRPIENLYRKHPYLESFAKMFPKSFKRFIQNLLLREKIMKKFILTPEQRQKVADALKDDMTRLHDKYGVDVKKWGF
jgi:hypothetical protein